MTETGWPNDVRREISAASRFSEFDWALLILPDVQTVHFDDAVELVPDLPLFQLRFGEGRRILEELWNPSSGFAGVVFASFAAGIVVDSYSGFPADNPGPEECTYEVASWGAA
jgi:hypothetical protein